MAGRALGLVSALADARIDRYPQQHTNHRDIDGWQQ